MSLRPRLRPRLAALACALCACTGPPEPTPPRVSPRAASGPVELVTRLAAGDALVRKSRVRLAYTVTASVLPGVVGRAYERELREELRETATAVDARGAPTALRRDVLAAAERILERDASGRATRDLTQHTPLHLRSFALALGADGEITAADAKGPLAATEAARIVFDLVTLRALLPTGPVAPGDTWSPPVDAWHALRGSTEPGRRLSGTIACRYARAVALDGDDAVEVHVTAALAIADEGSVEGKLDYSLATTLDLQGSYWHDVARAQPRRLTLRGTAVLAHRPTAVRFIPLGAESLSQPLDAAGELELELEVPPR